MSPKAVVVITGVSSGIGRATAHTFAGRGYQVYGTVRRAQGLEPMAGVEYVEMDLQDGASVKNAIDGIIAKSSHIDILVNNAGVSLTGSVEETSMAEAEWIFDTNVMGVVRVTQAVLPHMRAAGAGRIVNLSSVLGFLPAPYMGLYSATKHALEGLSESLDHEVRQFGIRVSLVEPTFTKTKLDINARAASPWIPAYDGDRHRAIKAIVGNVDRAPSPDVVAQTIFSAAVDAWQMRRAPKGKATLLRKMRRFLPFAPVDQGIRKEFGLA